VRLALFPLPTVLLPGARIPLHIFEPRYRQMVARCLESDGRFGLVYHDPDRHGPFHVQAARIGTVARIERFDPLPDGRSNIVCRGEDRFRVDDGLESGTAFHEAVVSPYEDVADDPPRLAAERERVTALFFRVLREVVEEPEPLPRLDPDGVASFQIARTIQIDPEWQQRLLESRSERGRLELIGALLGAVLAAHARGDVERAGDAG
jgi:Lon protease-like protein